MGHGLLSDVVRNHFFTFLMQHWRPPIQGPCNITLGLTLGLNHERDVP